ncbi:MAG: hypothetical protein H8E37_05950 [Planctomycetes bacterium]|nr:hypothetical protein [Planctomycetota bacterium]
MSSTDVGAPTNDRSALAELGWLIGLGAVFAGVLAGPAWWLAGSKGLTGLAVSAALCLIPGCLAVLVRVRGGSSATVVLVSIGLRLAFVLTGALVARLLATDYGMREFFVWLIAFYLFTLAVETWFGFQRNVTPS